MNTSNPYQPSSLPADQGHTVDHARPSPLAGIVAVAVGAVVGGVSLLVFVGWIGGSIFPFGDNALILTMLFLCLPLGCVVGGLSAKLCLLRVVGNR